LSLIIVILIGGAVAWAGSQNGATALSLPIFALAVGLIFLIQWIAFIPAYVQQSERFYDLTGSLTYISITILAIVLAPVVDSRSILVLALVIIWAGRLGTFLYGRIKRAGKDGRFDELKPSFVRFLVAWTTQALWVTLTLSAAMVIITSGTRRPLGWVAAVGLIVWLLGFGLEAVADAQKSRFRANPNNKGRFIDSGLWAWSRHPNYMGEILLWVGVLIIALPVLRGWQWIALISPVFVAVLLTRVSGVPLLEKRADEKWGGQKAYEAYKARTPVLIPRPPQKDA